MDTKKFEYLETIRETIELGDYDELDDYVEDIREQVKGDPQFEELFAEIKSRRYGDVISLIEEFIYEDIQAEEDHFLGEESLKKMGIVDEGLDFSIGNDPVVQEEISFEEFIEDSFTGGQSQEEEY